MASLTRVSLRSILVFAAGMVLLLVIQAGMCSATTDGDATPPPNGDEAGAGAEPPKRRASSRRRAKAAAEFAGYAAHHPLVQTVTSQQFRELVVEPTLPIVLTFYATKNCPGCERFAPNFVAAAEALRGHAICTAFDGGSEEGQGLAQMFGVQNLPALLLFNPVMLPVDGQPNSYMKVPVSYQGDGEVMSIVKWAMESIATDQISRIDDVADLDAFIAKYPFFDLPKIVLVTTCNSTSPVFRAMSHEFRYAALFGVVTVPSSASASLDPARKELVQDRLGVESFPSLCTITNDGVTTHALLESEPSGLDVLRKIISPLALSVERRKAIQPEYMQQEIAERKRIAEEAKKVRALPAVVASTKEEWETTCLKRKKGACVAVFVETTADAPLDTFNAAAEEMAKRLNVESQFVVVSGWEQPEIAAYFGAAENGFPSVVYIHPQRRVFVNHIGSLAERSLVSFWVDRGAKGRGKPLDAAKVPAWKETKAAPDGADDDIAVGDEL